MKIWAAVATAVLVIGVGWHWLSDGSSGDRSGDSVDEISATDVESSEPQFAGLDDASQERIWDLEHFTFELEKKFGRSLTRTLAERDEERGHSFFLDDFTGSIPDAATRTVHDGGWWTETTDLVDESAAVPCDAASVVGYLLGRLQRFAHTDSLKLRVLDIRSDPPEGSDPTGDDRWKLKVLISADGATDDDQPISLESTHTVFCRFHSDEQIVAGRIVTEWHVQDVRLRTAQTKFMTEITEQAKLDRVNLRDNWRPEWSSRINPYGSQIAVDDFDQDGFPDIAISSPEGMQLVLRNSDGQHFDDITSNVGINGQRRNARVTFATWVDFDNDGFPDLLLGDSLYHNDDGKRFTDVTSASGLRFHTETMGCVVADYDCDGLLDLYVLNHRGAMNTSETIGYVDDDRSGAPNQLWHNEGNGRFRDVTRKAGVRDGARHSFSAAWLFVDNDHYPDLYVANDFGRNALYRNLGNGRFRDITESTGVGDFATSMGVATGDLDGDGSTEIYVANMFSKMGRRIIAHVGEDDYPPGIYKQIQGSCAGNRLYRPDASGETYRECSTELGINEVGWAYAPALADFDGDGLLDIYATSGFLSFDRHKPDG